MKEFDNLLETVKPLNSNVSLGGGAITRDWLDV